MKISLNGSGAHGRITERLPMPPLPTREEVAAMDLELERERVFWTENAEELTKLYPEKFVAVYEGNVVAVDDDLFDVIRLTGEQGLRPRQVWVQYLTPHPVAIDL